MQIAKSPWLESQRPLFMVCWWPWICRAKSCRCGNQQVCANIKISRPWRHNWEAAIFKIQKISTEVCGGDVFILLTNSKNSRFFLTRLPIKNTRHLNALWSDETRFAEQGSSMSLGTRCFCGRGQSGGGSDIYGYGFWFSQHHEPFGHIKRKKRAPTFYCENPLEKSNHRRRKLKWCRQRLNWFCFDYGRCVQLLWWRRSEWWRMTDYWRQCKKASIP